MNATIRRRGIALLLLSLGLALATLPLASTSAAPSHWPGHARFVHATDDAPDESDPSVPPAAEPSPVEEPPVEPAPAPVADIPIEVPTDPVPLESATNDESDSAPETADAAPASEPSETVAAAPHAETDADDATVDDNQPDDSGDFTAAAAPVAVDDTATTHQRDEVDVPALANDTDADGDGLSYAGFTQPANGFVFQPIFPAGMLRYRANAGFVGVDSFTYTVTDGTDTATATITVTVTNTPPVALDDTTTTHQGDEVDVPARANDTDADGDSLSYTGFTQPTNGSVFQPVSPPGMLRYTPDDGFVGTDSFTYTISDGAATASATITVTVTNTDPVAVDDTATVHQGDFVDVPARANDTDADGDNLAYGSFTQPANGSVFRPASPPNMLRYTPDPGFVGTDSFTYDVSDGAATATATITVTVTNTDPVAVDDAATVNPGTFVDVPALTNDTDADGDGLAYVSFTQPTNGSVFRPVSPPLMLRYTPNAGFAGTDTFTYIITDGAATATGTVTVTVLSVQTNLPPVAVDDSYTTTQDTALNVPLPGIFANDSDPNGDDFGISSANVVPTAAHGSLTVSSGDGAFQYTPDPGFFGADSFQYQLTDGQALGNVATVTITIEPAAVENQPPVAVDDAATTTEGTPVTIAVLANDFDPDDGTGVDDRPELFLESLVEEPANGTAAFNPDNTITYTPAAGFTGTDHFTYTIADGSSSDDSAPATVTITVTGTAPEPDPDPDPPAEPPEEPKNEESTPKQPATKPAPKPTTGATALPDTGVGPSTGRDQDHALLLGLLLVLFGALVAAHMIRRHPSS